jgi:hypothetical protein
MGELSLKVKTAIAKTGTGSERGPLGKLQWFVLD